MPHPATRHLLAKATDSRPPAQHVSPAGAQPVTYHHLHSFPNTALERASQPPQPTLPATAKVPASCQALPPRRRRGAYRGASGESRRGHHIFHDRAGLGRSLTSERLIRHGNECLCARQMHG
ncbi:hypothetical protein GWK47_036103 [Chionoecetes opilio]|uniref:Uncharacterized protein n=1 Tax=Chionoecetes opilio TaxID=41210 RepID=A0A8J5CZU7_CHIOP|nr:hypothetical protein GWK47_036103 [Chionoecetes opilio]